MNEYYESTLEKMYGSLSTVGVGVFAFVLGVVVGFAAGMLM